MTTEQPDTVTATPSTLETYAPTEPTNGIVIPENVTPAAIAAQYTNTTLVAKAEVPAPVSVIARRRAERGDDPLLTKYFLELTFKNLLMGGIPNKPELLDSWLLKNAGIQDTDERAKMVWQTLAARMGTDVAAFADGRKMLEVSNEELRDIAGDVADTAHKNGFLRDRQKGLFIESRQIKAGLKESVNAMLAGRKGLGITNKGAKAFLAERVFPTEDRVYLGRAVPDGDKLFIGHVNGAGGQRNTLTLYEYVERPVLRFELSVIEDAIPQDVWDDVWESFELQGLGALRSQGHGQFVVTDFVVTQRGRAYVAVRGRQPARKKAADDGVVEVDVADLDPSLVSDEALAAGLEEGRLDPEPAVV